MIKKIIRYFKNGKEIKRLIKERRELIKIGMEMGCSIHFSEYAVDCHLKNMDYELEY